MSGINDIYIANSSTDYNSLLQRCKRLLEQGCLQIYIHGFGQYINRAINLALQLKEVVSTQKLEISVNTGLVDIMKYEELIDIFVVRPRPPFIFQYGSTTINDTDILQDNYIRDGTTRKSD